MALVGIDLGTTNSAIAFWNGNEPELIKNSLGEYLTPSVVGLDNSGEVLVGQVAKERLISHPELTAANFKRSVGTDKIYYLGDKQYSSTELSSLVLSALKADAEAFLEQPIESVIISVPAYFNDHQRKATKTAAELAGLKVERLINEPTAAALAYGLENIDQELSYLILDIGGGTFDVTTLELFDGVMEVCSTAGDNHLGGEDFTQTIVLDFISQHQLKENQLDSKTRWSLTKKSELLKRELSSAQQASMAIDIDGKTYDYELDNEQFANLCLPLISKLMAPIERALKDAKLTPSELDHVIMVGGASRTHIYKQALVKILRRMPSCNLNEDLVIAMGAAVQAGLKEKHQALKEVVMTDVSAYSLGVNVYNKNDTDNKIGDYFDPIIERNTVLPASRVSSYYPAHDNQTEMRFEVLQGESRYARNNLKLGEITIKVPKNKANAEQVDVRFSYDMSGLIELDALVVSTGETHNLVIEQNPFSISEKEMTELRAKLQKLKFHPRETLENRAFKARLERLYEENKGEIRDYVGRWIDYFEQALHSQDNKVIAEVTAELEGYIQELEGAVW